MSQPSKKVSGSEIIDNGDVVFSWSGSLLIDIWCGGKGALNQHLFKVTSDHYPSWFYYYWTKYYMIEFQRIAAGKATTMGHIKRQHLSEALVVVPSDEILQVAHRLISPLIAVLINNNLQSRTLAELRDALLPKLISGQIRVSDAERLIGDAP
jgi:type I restriction enzyme S subunit